MSNPTDTSNIKTEETLYTMLIESDIVVSSDWEPILGYLGHTIGFLLPDGRQIKPIPAFEILNTEAYIEKNPTEEEYYDITDEDELQWLGLHIDNYTRRFEESK